MNIETIKSNLKVAKDVSIRMKDGHYYDRCKVNGVGDTIAMVKTKGSADEEAVLLEEILEVTVLKVYDEAEQKPKKTSNKPASSAIAAKPKKVSKKAYALELYNEYPHLSRKTAIELLMEKAELTRAGAGTYYHNIWKANNG